MIRFDSVTYRYPESDSDVISQIDLDISEGEFLLILGESGSGKSTILRATNGLIPHFYGGKFSGSVTTGSRSTLSGKPRDFADVVGFVGQDPETHGVATRVEDDIAFTLENLGIEPGVMRKRVEETLDALSIAGLRHRRLETLSGGERQRAAIASVIVAMPSHLVLDEPTSQLDPQSAEEVISSILRLRDEIGIAIVLAEHRTERVIQYADRVGVVSNGKAEAGPPLHMLESSGFGPPVARLGREMGWSPLPLDLREARRFVESLKVEELLPPLKTSLGAEVARVQGIEVSLGGNVALRGVDFAVAEGEGVVLAGRNGSGKSTLLRVLAGLAKPNAGTVLAPSQIALVPQNPERMLFRKTVADELGATLRGRNLPSDTHAVNDAAAQFGIGRLLARYPRELSGGEKTAVAIAAAAAGDPKLILLDEPTRGMDAAGKQALESLIGKWRKEGRAVVLATHDVELAARLATRIVLLGEGEVVVDGPPSVVLSESITFSTQMNKVFGRPSVLTVEDALNALGRK